MNLHTIEDIRDAYNRKEYETKLPYISRSAKVKPEHIFDENKTVKWNKEKAVEHNATIEQLIEERLQDQQALNKKLKNDIINVLMKEYNFNEEQARLVYDYTYCEYHSRMNDFFNQLSEVSEMVEKAINSILNSFLSSDNE